MLTHMRRPVVWMSSARRQDFSPPRWPSQNFAMPSSVSENVRNTLIEYITTSVVMSPFV